MLYLIGLGLNSEGISKEGFEIMKRCKKVYLENYTVDFPYTLRELEEKFQKKIISVDRKFVENLEFLDEAARSDVALLIYGSPLTATTHITIIEEARASKIKVKVIYAASVFDGICETGLQIYKFGKTASMPKWDEKKNFIPDSFMEIVKENLSIHAHTLILCDIGLSFEDALKELKTSAKNHNINLEKMKIIICQKLGTKHQMILYDKISNLESEKNTKRIEFPFCIIIPSKLHFVEAEALKRFED